MDALTSQAVERAVRRNLRGAGVLAPRTLDPETELRFPGSVFHCSVSAACNSARIDWQATQLEILSASWIHRIQKLDFPQLPEFKTKQAKPEAPESCQVLDVAKKEEVLDKLARMQVIELQNCREAVSRMLSQLSSLP